MCLCLHHTMWPSSSVSAIYSHPHAHLDTVWLVGNRSNICQIFCRIGTDGYFIFFLFQTEFPPSLQIILFPLYDIYFCRPWQHIYFFHCHMGTEHYNQSFLAVVLFPEPYVELYCHIKVQVLLDDTDILKSPIVLETYARLHLQIREDILLSFLSYLSSLEYTLSSGLLHHCLTLSKLLVVEPSYS